MAARPAARLPRQYCPAGGAQGAVVYFPPGQYQISSTIDLPNRVALHGPNGRGACRAGYQLREELREPGLRRSWESYPYMFHAYRVANGQFASMFGSRIQDMELDFNDVAIAGSAMIGATHGRKRTVWSASFSIGSVSTG